jgi:hypothetical protein
LKRSTEIPPPPPGPLPRTPLPPPLPRTSLPPPLPSPLPPRTSLPLRVRGGEGVRSNRMLLRHRGGKVCPQLLYVVRIPLKTLVMFVGRRSLVSAVGSGVDEASSGVAVSSRGRTYDIPSLPPRLAPGPVAAPVAAGYTRNHARYQEQHKVWSRRASGTKEEVSIKVFMGHVPPGKRNIKQIGVSNDT